MNPERFRSYLILGIISVIYLWTLWTVSSVWEDLRGVVGMSLLPAVGSWIAWVILTEGRWGEEESS